MIRLKCYFRGHDMSVWAKHYNQYDERQCKRCGYTETKPWTDEEIAEYRKEQQERWIEEAKEHATRMNKFDENEILDRRGERLYANSHVWCNGNEMTIVDFHIEGEHSGRLLLVPKETRVANVGWGYTAWTNSVVKLP